MYKKRFDEVDLTIVELPVEWIDGKPQYAGFIRELPFIAAEASSLQEVYRQLAIDYDAYRQKHLPVEAEEETTKETLTLEELLRYYDGETIDGFADYFKSE